MGVDAYACRECGLKFEIDWGKETLCANCGSIQPGNPIEDDGWACGKCKSIAFNHKINKQAITCPQCRKARLLPSK